MTKKEKRLKEVYSNLGALSRRWKVKPWYDGEIRVETLRFGGTTGQDMTKITSVVGKDTNTQVKTTVIVSGNTELQRTFSQCDPAGQSTDLGN